MESEWNGNMLKLLIEEDCSRDLLKRSVKYCGSVSGFVTCLISVILSGHRTNMRLSVTFFHKFAPSVMRSSTANKWDGVT